MISLSHVYAATNRFALSLMVCRRTRRASHFRLQFMRFAAPLLLVMIATCIPAADGTPGDPAASMRVRALASVLTSLADSSRPEDQATALRCLAWLSLGDTRRTTCADAWSDEITIRLAKRPAAPADDLPERWIKLVRGDAAGAVAGLTSVTEEARALHAIAMQDPSLVTVSRDRTAIALQAAISAASALKRPSLFPEFDLRDPRLDACFETVAVFDAGSELDLHQALVQWEELATWILQAPVDIPAGAGPLVRMGAISGALDRLRTSGDPALGLRRQLAWHVLDRCYSLFALHLWFERQKGDYASWLARRRPELEAVGTPPVLLARALLSTMRDTVDWYQNARGDVPDKQSVADCAKLLTGALTDGWGGQRIGWCATLAYLAVADPEAAAPLVERAVALWPGGAAAPEPGGLETLAEAAWQSSTMTALHPLLESAVRRDPWEYAFAYRARQQDPALPVLRVDGRAIDATWVQEAVDIASLPFPQAPEGEFFTITWSGTVEIPVAGRWWFGVESDDDAFLRVGPALIQNRGAHGMQRRGTSVQLPAGPQPLRLEYVNRFMGAGCRLLWGGPGLERGAVPATALSHGEARTPGLMAAYSHLMTQEAVGSVLAPSAELAAWANAHPRSMRAQVALAEQYTYHLRYDETESPLLRLNEEPGLSFQTGILWIPTLLLGKTVRVDEAIPYIRRYGTLGFDDRQTWRGLWAVRKAGRQVDVLAALGDIRPGDHKRNLPRAFLEAEACAFGAEPNIARAVRAEHEIGSYARGYLLLAEIAYKPLSGKTQADSAEVHGLVERHGLPKEVALACDVVLGTTSPAIAREEVKGLEEPGVIVLAEGLRAMMEGRWDEAKRLLEAHAVGAPDQAHGWMAKGIASWIARTPAAERDRLPRIAPVPAKAVPPPERSDF